MTTPNNINFLIFLAAADQVGSDLTEIDMCLFNLVTTVTKGSCYVVLMGLVNAILEMGLVGVVSVQVKEAPTDLHQQNLQNDDPIETVDESYEDAGFFCESTVIGGRALFLCRPDTIFD